MEDLPRAEGIFEMRNDILSEYEYVLRLNTGSNRVRLAFYTDKTAEVSFKSAWMGGTNQTYHLSCLHQPITRNHGFLRVIRIEQEAIGTIFNQPNTEVYKDDVYGLHVLDDVRAEYEIVYEYFILHNPMWHFSGDRVLDDIRLTTGGDWNDTFSLFLYMLDGLTRLPDDNVEIKQVLSEIDKIKLRQVGDERLPDDI